METIYLGFRVYIGVPREQQLKIVLSHLFQVVNTKELSQIWLRGISVQDSRGALAIAFKIIWAVAAAFFLGG